MGDAKDLVHLWSMFWWVWVSEGMVVAKGFFFGCVYKTYFVVWYVGGGVRRGSKCLCMGGVFGSRV